MNRRKNSYTRWWLTELSVPVPRRTYAQVACGGAVDWEVLGDAACEGGGQGECRIQPHRRHLLKRGRESFMGEMSVTP